MKFTRQLLHLRSFKRCTRRCLTTVPMEYWYNSRGMIPRMGGQQCSWTFHQLRLVGGRGGDRKSGVLFTFCKRERREHDRGTSKLCLMMRWHRWEHTPEEWVPHVLRLASKTGIHLCRWKILSVASFFFFFCHFNKLQLTTPLSIDLTD